MCNQNIYTNNRIIFSSYVAQFETQKFGQCITISVSKFERVDLPRSLDMNTMLNPY